jgi:hypothetical protein
MVATGLALNAGAGTLNNVHTLPVELRAQVNDAWCWAASGEMAMRYVGQKDVPQCEIAKIHLKLTVSCCGVAATVPQTCVQGAWLDPSDFLKLGFADQEKTLLTFDEIMDEIAQNRPVIDWSSEGHMMVIAGHGLGGNGNEQLWIKDPSPTSPDPTQGGEAYWMKYTKYKKHVYKSYYNIRKTTPNPQ